MRFYLILLNLFAQYENCIIFVLAHLTNKNFKNYEQVRINRRNR